jgi:SSS family solute:Na+ symporter
VIVTDVIQATLLFGAAVMTILLITFDLGGVGAWWPTEWAPNWDRFALGFAPDARLAVSSMMLSSLVWYVSTAGSDQLSIQRYLATRDAPAARRMYGISLASIALVEVFLALLGLALLAFFRAHPEAMGDPEMIVKKPDSLFLRFIAVRMPPGVTGLAVAALLATSMSALSAGLSSTCSVISVDLVDRFRRRSGESEGRHVWLVRCISWGVGALVIGLSLFVGLVPGNLFEVAGKVINLFVAPLFVLFVMALFVPWANTLGTLTGAAASLAAAVAVSLFEVGGLSFIWIQPVSLAVGIVVGTVVSLLPFGRRRPVETAEIDPQMQSEERL